MHQIGTVSKDDAVKHRTMVASHTEKPFRFFEMAGMRLPPNNIACLYGRRHGLRMSLT